MIVASFPASLKNFRGSLIEEILTRGHEVHAVAPDLKKDVTAQSWLSERGVVCHDIALSRNGLRPASDLKALLELYSLCSRIQPDLVLAYTIKPVIWGMLAAYMTGVQQRFALITGLGYAFTGENEGLRRVVRSIARGLYRLALKRVTLVFFQNPDDRNDFLRFGILAPHIPVRIVSGSGVDTQYFKPSKLPKTPIHFLLIARLLGDKGIREYAAAAAELKEQWPKAEFHLVGPLDPNPDSISETEVRSWQDAGHLIWHGPLTDVRPALSDCHVYVLPSYREGTPRTVLEAMSMGRPVITTDAPGCRETVKDGVNGFLVPVRDASALRVAMEKFLSDPSLIPRMGTQSRRIAEERYDVHKVNSAMISAMKL